MTHNHATQQQHHCIITPIHKATSNKWTHKWCHHSNPKQQWHIPWATVPPMPPYNDTATPKWWWPPQAMALLQAILPLQQSMTSLLAMMLPVSDNATPTQWCWPHNATTQGHNHPKQRQCCKTRVTKHTNSASVCHLTPEQCTVVNAAQRCYTKEFPWSWLKKRKQMKKANQSW